MGNGDWGLVALPAGLGDWAEARDADPDFEKLSAEIKRMSSMTDAAASPPKWDLVADCASRILCERAKDIQVASYAAVALFNVNGLQGFSDGLKILGDILSLHGATAFPPPARKRARLNAFSWWLERALAFIENDQGEISSDQKKELDERFAALDAALFAAFENDAPMLAGIRSALARIAVKYEPPPVEETVEAVEVTADTKDEAKSAAAAPATHSTAISAPARSAPDSLSPEQARKELQNTLAYALALAETAAGNSADPLPYRLRRMGAWASIRTAPPAEKGKTLLPGPESHVAQAMESLFASGDYEGALKLAEEQVTIYLFWLDPHRVAAQCLAAMGPMHEAARLAVEMEVKLFLKRLSIIPSLSFSDDRAFADGKTHAWLASLNEESGGGDNPEIAKTIEKARGAAATKPEDALRLLREAGSGAGRPRDRLLLRVETMKTLAVAGKPSAIRAQASDLLVLLDRYGVCEWEPELAAAALGAAAAGYVGLGDTPLGEDDARLGREVLRRLGNIAPETYLGLVEK